MSRRANWFLGLSCAALIAAPATAGMTTTVGSREADFNSILLGIYGPGSLGHFSGAAFGGVRYTNGVVSLERVDDFKGASQADRFKLGDALTPSAVGPGTTDQIWTNALIRASARARFAGYEQRFGYFHGASGWANSASFVSLGAAIVSGMQNTTLGEIDLLSSDWRWGRIGSGQIWSSRASDNADGLDHLITYRVVGTGGPAEWLLFWDDQYGGGDRDFNDLVVQVSAVTAVPTPGAALLGMLGLLSMRSMRRWVS